MSSFPDRRQFLKELGFAAVATAALGTIPRRIAHAHVVASRRPWSAKRPFNIVAIGDSIVWGQGLATEQKFTSLTREWLEQRLRVPVTLAVFAHSGAVIARRPDDASCTYKTVYAGEPPNLAPSITAQAWWAAGKGPPMCAGGPRSVAPNDEVDLVIMDGGINDVDIAHILNPAFTELLALTRKSCRVGMTSLLGDVATLFPNASVLVTGYYPIVSEASDISVLGPALFNVGLLGIPSQVTAFARGYGGNCSSPTRSNTVAQCSCCSSRYAVNSGGPIGATSVLSTHASARATRWARPSHGSGPWTPPIRRGPGASSNASTVMARSACCPTPENAESHRWGIRTRRAPARTPRRSHASWRRLFFRGRGASKSGPGSLTRAALQAWRMLYRLAPLSRS